MSRPDVDLEARLVSLGRALAHPVRAAVLRYCCRDADRLHSPVELSRALGVALGVVSYHVRVLADLGMLELRRTGQARGAVVHEYGIADGVAVAVEALARHA